MTPTRAPGHVRQQLAVRLNLSDPTSIWPPRTTEAARLHEAGWTVSDALATGRTRARNLTKELAALANPEPSAPVPHRLDPATFYADYQRLAAEELTARVQASIATALGADAVERIVPVARRVEVAGVDATGILCRAGQRSWTEADLVSHLARQALGGRPAAPYAGMLPPPPATADPDAVEQLDRLGKALEAWRDDLASRLVAGEQPPQWALPLGPAPVDPDVRATWAADVALVGVWKAAHRLQDDDPLGPAVSLDHPEGAARARVVAAGRAARQLAHREPVQSGPLVTPSLVAPPRTHPTRSPFHR